MNFLSIIFNNQLCGTVGSRRFIRVQQLLNWSVKFNIMCVD